MLLYNWVKVNLFKIAAAISILSCIILLFIKIYFSLSFLPDLSGSEISTIFPIQFLADNQPPYTNPEEAPFRLTQYTPIYPLIASSLFKMAGWLPTEVHKVFLTSRFLSMGFTLSAVLVVAWIISILGKREKVTGILAAGMIFQVLGTWILTSSRPDSLVVLLTALYVFTVFKATTSLAKRDLWYILAIFISVTAFFVKQSGTIHAIALAAFCIYQLQWKLLAKLILAGIVFFGIYLFLLPINSIPNFISNVVGGVKNSASWGWFYTWTLEKFLLQFAPLIVCNFVISVYSLTRKRSELYTFLAVSSTLFFIFATSTAFKIGAGVGYYQDYLVLSVIQIALFFTDPISKKWFEPQIFKALLAFYLVIVSVHTTLFVYMTYSEQPLGMYTNQYIQERNVAEYLIKERKLADKDWVYVCDISNMQGLYLKHFLFKNILVPFPDIVYLAEKNHTFNFEKFKSMIRNNEIRFVISQKGKAPVNILYYKFGNLKKIKTIDDYDIYEY